jgi:putative addiction module killer protein
LKIDYGPGYRVYLAEQDRMIVILLCGGDKRTQNADIAAAKSFWRAFKKEQRNANR